MNDNLTELMDSLDELLNELRSRVNDWDRVCFALYEEANDDAQSDLIARLLIEAGTEGAGIELAVKSIQAVLADAAKELLK